MTRDQIIEMSNVWLSEFGMQELRRGAEVEIELNDLEAFADKILEEVAQEIAKLPFGDTASSFAVFVRQMKVNRSDNESGRSPLSATSTSAK